jgi:hypothetical protein
MQILEIELLILLQKVSEYVCDILCFFLTKFKDSLISILSFTYPFKTFLEMDEFPGLEMQQISPYTFIAIEKFPEQTNSSSAYSLLKFKSKPLDRKLENLRFLLSPTLQL